MFFVQGVLQGVTAGILFPLLVAYPAKWFKRRRSLAIGIVIAGSSIGTFAIKYVLKTISFPDANLYRWCHLVSFSTGDAYSTWAP